MAVSRGRICAREVPRQKMVVARTSRLNVGYLNKVKGIILVLSSSGYVLVNLVAKLKACVESSYTGSVKLDMRA